MGDSTTSGMNPEIGGVWQWKALVCTSEHDWILPKLVSDYCFRRTNIIGVFLAILQTFSVRTEIYNPLTTASNQSRSSSNQL